MSCLSSGVIGDGHTMYSLSLGVIKDGHTMYSLSLGVIRDGNHHVLPVFWCYKGWPHHVQPVICCYFCYCFFLVCLVCVCVCSFFICLSASASLCAVISDILRAWFHSIDIFCGNAGGVFACGAWSVALLVHLPSSQEVKCLSFTL